MTQRSALIIKEILQQKRITKTEFAKLIGVGRVSLYKYLAGGNIHPLIAKRIRQVLFETYDLSIPLEKLID